MMLGLSAVGQTDPKEGVIKVRKINPINFYLEIEQIPDYDGNLIQEIEKMIHFPDDARKLNKEGVVLVSCIIDERGKVIWTDIKKGVFPSLDLEATKVVKKLNGFQPYEKNGKVYPVKFDIPVKFSISANKT